MPLLKAQNDYTFSKFGGHGPLGPLATPMYLQTSCSIFNTILQRKENAHCRRLTHLLFFECFKNV